AGPCPRPSPCRSPWWRRTRRARSPRGAAGNRASRWWAAAGRGRGRRRVARCSSARAGGSPRALVPGALVVGQAAGDRTCDLVAVARVLEALLFPGIGDEADL